MTNLIKTATEGLRSAIAFATAKHAGQTRKYTGEPYVNHCLAVAEIVAATGATETTIAAAVLHDTLEDTATTEAELLTAFGPEVTKLVIELTNIRTPGTRAERKAKDRARLATVSAEAQTIKVADLIHNTGSIAEHDPEFAKVFIPEANALLAVLTKADPVLACIGKFEETT
jgi:(p)ppGpp synthase/HD superfamily hydrolase